MVGVIARADLTGLGIQSRNWIRLLDPDKVIVINSRPFNSNEQHFEWYSNRRNAYRIDGFIKPNEMNPILDNLDVLLTFEIPYNYDILRVARNRGIKTIIQTNWEFLDYLKTPDLPLPDLLVNHSRWHLDEQEVRWPHITEYCPTPLFVEDYDEIYQQNLTRDATEMRRFVHIAGRKTYQDRNGTQDLIGAMKLVPKEEKFELVIKTQNTEIEPSDDKRITIDRSMPADEKELYRNFDAMVMPRKYGGACLPMNESLAAGLPVIMPRIDPNDKILPNQWLIQANVTSSVMTRAQIDIYTSDHQQLATKLVEFNNMTWEDLQSQKILAREIAVREYSSEVVKEKWAVLMSKIGLQ